MGIISGRSAGYENLSKITISTIILLFLLVFPLIGDTYFIHLVILSLIWAVVSSAWNLIMGYAGITTFGTLAFFSVGAYVAGISEVSAGVSPWLGLILGGIGAALAGFIISFPCLRVSGLYIVLVTVAFHQVIPIFIKLAGKWTGGDVGLIGMPHYQLWGYNFGDSRIRYYYLIFFFFVFFHFIIFKIIRSRMGKAFVALRDEEAFAESLGVDRTRYSVAVFCISSFIMGVMGSLYVHYLKVATPRILEMELFASAIMMVIIGGLGKFPGVILSAFVVTFLNELLRTAGLVRPIIFGASIIAVILLFPEGFSGLIDRLTRYMGQTFAKIRTN